MKIKCKKKSYEQVVSLPPAPHRLPLRSPRILRWLIKALSFFELKKVKMSYREVDMDKLESKQPCLILMNHSSFIDLKIAFDYFYPRPLSTVCTTDGFVGKELLMRLIGCIPTQKFVSDVTLLQDMLYALGDLGSSVLMYPEASYSFDGTATPLPDSLGGLLKLLNVPVVTLITDGAFIRDPLYNGLRLRKTEISAEVRYLLSPEQIAEASTEELNLLLAQVFSFDNFRSQQQRGVKIDEPFRAEGLNRVLYKCPHCLSESDMTSEGDTVKCRACGAVYRLTETGFLEGVNVEPKFTHIPDWYAWERECVRAEIESGTYLLDVDVDIIMMVNFKAVYRVGEGRLTHSESGFHLVGCDGKLDYTHRPLASYSLYADYFWYELGDIICIGNKDALYYCFPRCERDVVAKTRLAAEEIYKIKRAARTARRAARAEARAAKN